MPAVRLSPFFAFRRRTCRPYSLALPVCREVAPRPSYARVLSLPARIRAAGFGSRYPSRRRARPFRPVPVIARPSCRPRASETGAAFPVSGLLRSFFPRNDGERPSLPVIGITLIEPSMGPDRAMRPRTARHSVALSRNGSPFRNPDGTDVAPGDAARPADRRKSHRGSAFCLRPTDSLNHTPPSKSLRGGSDFSAGYRYPRFFRRGKLDMVLPEERHRDLLRAPGRQQFPRKLQLFFVRSGGKHRIVEKPLAVALEDGGGGWRRHPCRIDPRRAQHAVQPPRLLYGTMRMLRPLPPSPAGAAAAMQQRFAVLGQVGMNDQIEFRQIDAARGDVGCHANTGPAVAHRLQGARALVLAQLPGKGDDRKPRSPAGWIDASRLRGSSRTQARCSPRNSAAY